MVEIRQWREIADDFQGALVLGNGASVAVHQEFRYKALKQEAKERGFLTANGDPEAEDTDPLDVEEVFRLLDTDDFELVLNLLWHAERVNDAFSIEDTKTGPAYQLVKNALINTVREVHCSRVEIGHHLKSIYDFMGRFETVLSLNYDLIVYWALLAANRSFGYYRFKDCFTGDQIFDLECVQQKATYTEGNLDTTLVFYPHGNLVLAEKPYEGEWKIFARANFLLERILGTWEKDEGFPLFVSEGLSPQKEGRIKNSPYLRMVYHDVLPNVDDTVAIYGWDLKENDQHLIDQLFRKRKAKVAVSIYSQDRSEESIEERCLRIRKTILDSSPSPKPEILFFDASSDGCWIHH